MSVLIIALLLLIGITLLVAEFFVFVGSAVSGIAGFILTAIGIFITYKTYGTTVGNYTLLATLILLAVAVYFSLQSKTWNKIALHSEIDGKVNTIEEHKINVGDIGQTISRLAPMGKVKVKDNIVEAKSVGIYVDENTEVEVIKVNGSNIIVKPLK